MAVDPGGPESSDAGVGWDGECEVVADVFGEFLEPGLDVEEVFELGVVAGGGGAGGVGADAGL